MILPKSHLFCLFSQWSACRRFRVSGDWKVAPPRPKLSIWKYTQTLTNTLSFFGPAFSLFHVMLWIHVILSVLSTQSDIGDWPKRKQNKQQIKKPSWVSDILVSTSEPVNGTRKSRGDNFVLWFLPCHDADNNICLVSGWWTSGESYCK